MRDLADADAEQVRDYLDFLARERDVAANTQNQALNALVFFFTQVLKRELGNFDDFTRAKRPRRLPVVLSRDEVQRLFSHLGELHALMAGLLYGSGLRLMECVRLRVQDVDCLQRQIKVRDGKGQKDRVTVLPDRCIPAIHKQLALARDLFDKDVADGIAGVYMPDSLGRKYPKARCE
jgi:site-specific recombinase XerD